MKPTVKFVIADVNMGMAHTGLDKLITAHAKANRLFAQSVKDGDLILFINKKKNRCKLFSHNGEVMGYLRLYGGRTLSQATVDLIPATFGGSVAYSGAVKSAFTRFMQAEESMEKQRRAKTMLLTG